MEGCNGDTRRKTNLVTRARSIPRPQCMSVLVDGAYDRGVDLSNNNIVLQVMMAVVLFLGLGSQ